MKLFLFTVSAMALLAMTKSLPCRGDNCGQLSPFYSEYDDEEVSFYIQEGSQNSASSNDDVDIDKDPEIEDRFGSQSSHLYEQQQLPNRQRSRGNYKQGVELNTPRKGGNQPGQQQNPTNQYDENEETQYGSSPNYNNQGNYKSGNQGGGRGPYQNNGAGSNGYYPKNSNQGGGGSHYQNNNAGSNGHYPGGGHQGGSGGYYQNNGAGYNGHHPGSGNQGGAADEDYYQNNGGSYGRYPDYGGQSSCPNCYATDFGNGNNNKNIINIEK